jgi:hypothetical protein
MLNVLKDLFGIDVWDIVVGCKLFAEVRFSSAGFTSKTNFKRLQSPLFAKLILDKLNISLKTGLAMPREVNLSSRLSSFFSLS